MAPIPGMGADYDAIVVGAGHNGLVAANQLAQRGWSVKVLEANDEPGGAVRSGEITEPGFISDRFSAFYPLAAASPVIQGLGLEDHGVRWRRAEAPVAHPAADGRCALLSLDLDETAASLDAFAPGDGDAWRRLFAYWQRVGPGFIESLLSPFPPIRGGARLLGALGPGGVPRFVRFSLVPVRRMAEEHFRGEGGAWLLAGNALHADLTPDSNGGGLFGWILCSLGQERGFPVIEGGAGGMIQAMIRRLESHGGSLETGCAVERILIRRGRAVGVRTAAGDEIGARAVLADVGAPRLFLEMVGEEHLPGGLVSDLHRFQYDNSSVKLDWALDGPIPWTAEEARRAGTIHVAEGMDALTRTTAQLSRNLIPDRPFLVLGQYASFEPTRAPAGKECAWAYTHIPQATKGDAGGDGLTGRWDERETEIFADRMEAEVERLAPGFRSLIRSRHIYNPAGLEHSNRNLVGGAVNSGTAQIHQQLIFRPTPGLGRAETPLPGLFLAGASAHPGGGVHGAAGANAARAALAARMRRRVTFAAGAAAGIALGRRS